jgi:hypothetical protein
MSLTLYGGVRGSPQYLVLIYSGGGPPTPPASMPAVATRAWTTPRSQCSTAAPSCCGGCRTRRPARPPTAPPRAGSSAGDGCAGLAGEGGERVRAQRARPPARRPLEVWRSSSCGAGGLTIWAGGGPGHALSRGLPALLRGRHRSPRHCLMLMSQPHGCLDDAPRPPCTRHGASIKPPFG